MQLKAEASDYALCQGDAVEYLNSLKPGSVHLGITDIAYESLEKHRKTGTTTRLKKSKASSNEWFSIFPNARIPELFSAFYRALANDSHLYMFCDDETAYVMKPEGEKAGFKYWKRLLWFKEKIGMGYHYRATCEYILFFEKGKRKLNDLGMGDVFDRKDDVEWIKEDSDGYVIQEPRLKGSDLYPTEKPVTVSEKLIIQSSLPGEIVCDPFCGSSSVGIAALRQNRRFLGCDLSDGAVNYSTARLREFLDTRVKSI